MNFPIFSFPLCLVFADVPWLHFTPKKISSFYHHDISVALIVTHMWEQEIIGNWVILFSKMCLTKPHTKDKVIAVFHQIQSFPWKILQARNKHSFLVFVFFWEIALRWWCKLLASYQLPCLHLFLVYIPMPTQVLPLYLCMSKHSGLRNQTMVICKQNTNAVSMNRPHWLLCSWNTGYTLCCFRVKWNTIWFSKRDEVNIRAS